MMPKTRAARHRDGTNQEKAAPGKYERPPRRVAIAAGASMKSPRPLTGGSRKKPGPSNGSPKRRWRREDLEAILVRMRDQQRRLNDVLKDPDFPPVATWKFFVRKHPEFPVKVQRIYFSFPYAFQSSLRKISPRLCMDCRRLNARKLCGTEIAKALGIPISLVTKALRQSDEEILRMEQRLALVDDAPPMYRLPRDIESIVKAARAAPGRRTPWRREDYDAILRRMRAQRRMLKDVCGDGDLPGIGSFRSFAMRRPEYRRKVERIHFSFPYKMQAGARRMSPWFAVDCRRLRARRLGVAEIARALEAPLSRVATALRQSPQEESRPDPALEDDGGGPPMYRLPDDIEFFVEDAYTTPGRFVAWRPEDFRAVLERMVEQGRTMKDVCFDIDLPGRSAWRGYEKRNPGTAAMVRRIHCSFPYKLQVEAGCISSRFHEDCLRLHARKLSIRQIAEVLDVPYGTVYRVVRHGKWGEEPEGPILDHGLKAPPIYRLPRDIDAIVDKASVERRTARRADPRICEIWESGDFWAIIDRIVEQRREIKEVCRDEDLPSYRLWRLFARKNPEFDAMERRLLHTFPYSVQVKYCGLSPLFSMDCRRLHDRGLTRKKISALLGVSIPTVRRGLEGVCEGKPWPEAALPEGFDAPPMYRLPDDIDHIVKEATARKKRVPKWGPEHFTAVLNRMREQRRSLNDVCKDPDLPGIFAWKDFVRLRPEFARKASRIHYALPYGVQLRIKDVSPFYQMDCVRLHQRGLSAQRIGKVLKVATNSVRRALQGVDPDIDFSEIVLSDDPDEPDEPPIHRLPRDIDAIVKKAMAPPGKKRPKWGRGHFEAILQRMRGQQRPLADVCRDPDLPPLFQWALYTAEHPEFKEEARRIHHLLPYRVQYEIRDVSPRFRMDCGRLRARGMKMKKIAEALDVTESAVLHTLKNFVFKTEGLPDNWLSMQWGREDFEAILDRMRMCGRTLYDVCKDPDLPGHFLWRRFARENPEFEEEARRIDHRHSYPVQWRLRNLSPRFLYDCERLWARGVSSRVVSEALGVPRSSVQRVLKEAGLGEHNRPHRLVRRHWARADFEAMLERMRVWGRSLRDAALDPDLPGSPYWERYAMKHPEFMERVSRINHTMPYSSQIKRKDVSPRFGHDCRRLRNSGREHKAIAGALGVPEKSVRRALEERDP